MVLVGFEPQPLHPGEPLWFKSFACYTLGALYCALFILSISLFAVIQYRDRRFSIQKTFYLLTGLLSAIRTVFWFANPTAAIIDWLYFLLWSLPGDLLFSTYSLLVFFWADAYHHCHGETAFSEYHRRRRLIILITLNVIMYIIQVGLYVMMIFYSYTYHIVQPYFFSVLAILSVAAFCVYGGLLIYTMRHSSIQSSFRKRKMQKVLAIVLVVAVSFIVRAVFNFLWPSLVIEVITVRGYYWAFCLPFYIVIEVMPTFCVVVVVTKIPPKVTENRGLPLMAKHREVAARQ